MVVDDDDAADDRDDDDDDDGYDDTDENECMDVDNACCCVCVCVCVSVDTSTIHAGADCVLLFNTIGGDVIIVLFMIVSYCVCMYRRCVWSPSNAQERDSTPLHST